MLTIWPSIQKWPYDNKANFERNYVGTFEVGVYQMLAECSYCQFWVLDYCIWQAMGGAPLVAKAYRDVLRILIADHCKQFRCLPLVQGHWLDDTDNTWLGSNEREADRGSSMANLVARFDLYEEAYRRGKDRTVGHRLAMLTGGLCAGMDMVFLGYWGRYLDTFIPETVRFFQSEIVDRTHLYFPCPDCTRRTRVPLGKGKIRIRCPHCTCQFIRET